MSTAPQLDPDVIRISKAIRALRERHGLTQRQAAEHHPENISYQYWALNEQGRVPGIVKPATQRKLLEAITVAANLDRALTLEDLQATTETIPPRADDARALRMAASMAGGRSDRQAVFPTTQGDVTFSFPADMDSEGFRELEAYFSVFLRHHTQSN